MAKPLVSRVTWDPVHDPEPLPDVAERYANSPAREGIHDLLVEAWAENVDTTDPDVMTAIIDAAERRHRAARATVDSRSLFEPDGTLHPPIVYYMRIGPIVKIGTTGRLAERLKAINPQGVMAIELGSRPLERRRHQEFAEWHIHGEWFHLSPEIAAHVVTVRQEFEQGVGQTTEAWISGVGAPTRP